MASEVRIGKFKMSRAGYAALQNSGAVQSQVSAKALAVESAANSMLRADGYRLPGYETKQVAGKLANGKVVRTKNDHARRDNAKRNTLLKALGASR